MEASAILHLYGCGVFKDEGLATVYKDICERIVIHGDQLSHKDEDAFLNLIEKVMSEKVSLNKITTYTVTRRDLYKADNYINVNNAVMNVNALASLVNRCKEGV